MFGQPWVDTPPHSPARRTQSRRTRNRLPVEALPAAARPSHAGQSVLRTVGRLHLPHRRWAKITRQPAPRGRPTAGHRALLPSLPHAIWRSRRPRSPLRVVKSLARVHWLSFVTASLGLAANPARGSERQFLPIPAVRPQLSGTGTQAGGPGVTTYTRPRLHGLFLQQSPASGVPVGSLGATRTYMCSRAKHGMATAENSSTAYSFAHSTSGLRLLVL